MIHQYQAKDGMNLTTPSQSWRCCSFSTCAFTNVAIATWPATALRQPGIGPYNWRMYRKNPEIHDGILPSLCGPNCPGKRVPLSEGTIARADEPSSTLPWYARSPDGLRS